MGVSSMISTVVYFEKAEAPVQGNQKKWNAAGYASDVLLCYHHVFSVKISLTAQALDILFAQRLRIVLITHNHDWFVVIR